MGMELQVPPQENIEESEFSVEQRDKDIQEAIDGLSKKFFGFGLKNDGPTVAKIFDSIAEKYKVYPDMVISPTSESDSEEVKKQTSRAVSFIEVYTSEAIEAALNAHFANKE